MRRRRSVRRRFVGRRVHHRQRACDRHRRRGASRRSERRRQQHRRRRHGARSRLPGAQSRPRARARAAGPRRLRIRGRHPAAEAELPAPQPARERPVPRRARRGGDAVVRFAHHRATGRRAGPRGVRACRDRSTPHSRRAGTSSFATVRNSSRPRRTSSTSSVSPATRLPPGTPRRARNPTPPCARFCARSAATPPTSTRSPRARALSIAATIAALTALEIERQVAPLPGGLWQRLG